MLPNRRIHSVKSDGFGFNPWSAELFWGIYILPQLCNTTVFRYSLPRKKNNCLILHIHYNDVIMGAIASQITSLTIVYSAVYSDTDQRKHQSSASLAFVWGIHRWPVNSPHKWPVTRKMFPFDDVIMYTYLVNIMAVDGLVTQGARLSATMILTWFPRIISAPCQPLLTSKCY